MSAVDLADAQAHLGDLVDRVEAGDSFEITRYRKPVAQLSAANRPRQRIALALPWRQSCRKRKASPTS